jgi:hypothetical protein
MFRSEIVGANFFFRRFEALIQSAIGENQFGVFFFGSHLGREVPGAWEKRVRVGDDLDFLEEVNFAN